MRKSIGTLAMVWLACTAVAPVWGMCQAPFLVSSAIPPGQDGVIRYWSYVVTPGVLESGLGLSGSSFSDRLEGFFWRVGFGDAATGRGIDNGSFHPLADRNVSAVSWFYVVPEYPSLLLTTWAASTGIDNCVDDEPGQRCMALTLADLDPSGAPFIALLVEEETDSGGDYFFNQPGNAPIELAPVPAASLVESHSEGPGTVETTFASPSFADVEPALYIDDACDVEGLVGYRILIGDPPADGGAAPPEREAWTALSEIVPLGETVTVAALCAAGGQLHFATGLVFDSGFESPYVAAHAALDCPQAEPTDREPPRVKPGRFETIRERTP